MKDTPTGRLTLVTGADRGNGAAIAQYTRDDPRRLDAFLPVDGGYLAL